MKKSISREDIKLFLIDYNAWRYNLNALNSLETLINYMLIKEVIDEEKFIRTIKFRKDLTQQNKDETDDSTKYEYIGR